MVALRVEQFHADVDLLLFREGGDLLEPLDAVGRPFLVRQPRAVARHAITFGKPASAAASIALRRAATAFSWFSLRFSPLAPERAIVQIKPCFFSVGQSLGEAKSMPCRPSCTHTWHICSNGILRSTPGVIACLIRPLSFAGCGFSSPRTRAVPRPQAAPPKVTAKAWRRVRELLSDCGTFASWTPRKWLGTQG